MALEARFAGRMWEWQGRIVRTDASIDVNSRVVYAVVEVDKPFAREAGSRRPPLAPGLFVNARISGREFSDVSLLPRSALRSDDTLMVVDRDESVRVRQVKVLRSTSEQVWVQGLEQGERVIVREPGLTFEGMKVVVHEDANSGGER